VISGNAPPYNAPTGAKTDRMSGNRRRYISYLLRLWQTQREGGLVWRASLESPTTGERQGFAGLAELFAFLEQETTPHKEGDQRQGRESGASPR
jgi:hypothetical protein